MSDVLIDRCANPTMSKGRKGKCHCPECRRLAKLGNTRKTRYHRYKQYTSRAIPEDKDPQPCTHCGVMFKAQGIVTHERYCTGGI